MSPTARKCVCRNFCLESAASPINKEQRTLKRVFVLFVTCPRRTTVDPTEMPKLKPSTQAARREHILDAAERCFARSGFHRTTMQDICREANIWNVAFATAKSE